jgi:LysR family transcriptional regulator, glycine cleavage system transcriptional activator
MRGRLPPLKALLVFEAAARGGSFARAAAELHVTPSAVSHQIQALESFLGLKLFRRNAGRVSLTRAGSAYWRRIESALQLIAEATAEIAPSHRDGSSITVLSATSFAAKWLRPRLIQFQTSYPSISVRLDTSTEPPDFTARNFDLAICYGPQAPSAAIKVLPLASETIMAMCSPALARRLRLQSPADLARAPLIHSANLTSWADWLTEAQVDPTAATAALWFDRSSLAIEAAVEGAGVILESDLLTAVERKARALVAPFRTGPRIRRLSYYLAYRGDRALKPASRAFIDWIRDAIPKSNRPIGDE